MYRIGEFSYLFKVTIKTLRYYDQINLFKPSFVDPYTGYRYYDKKQVEEFENIMRLKDLNFSLDEIKKLKEKLSEEVIKQKIRELEDEQYSLKTKINHLENMIVEGDSKMSYKIAWDNNAKITVIGKHVSVEKRTDAALELYYKEIEKALDKLKINYHSKIVITEEVGYKEEDVELFIGYKVNLSSKDLKAFLKKKEKLSLDWFDYPTMDYLVAMDVLSNDVSQACKDLVRYANDNEIQLIGPFMEVSDWYSGDNLDICVLAHDLKRNDIHELLAEKRNKELYEKDFVLNKIILGTWRIREILPNIEFNPNRQKSSPDTKFNEIVFLDNGKTNYDNVSWSKSNMFIKNNDIVISNSMRIIEIDKKEYLEIRMNDMSTVYPNAKPISYIYERI